MSFLPAISDKAAKAIRVDDPRLAAGRHPEQSVSGGDRGACESFGPWGCDPKKG